MSFFGHLGKTACPFVFQLHVHDVSPLFGSTEPLHLLVARGKKQHQTRVAMADGRRCQWDEGMPIGATLYAKKATNASAALEYDKKVYTFTVQTDKAGRRSSLSMPAGGGGGGGAAAASAAQKLLQLSTEIDLSVFAAPGSVGKEVTRSFPLKGKGGESSGGGPTPMLKLTIKASPVKPGESAKLSQLEVPSDGHGHGHRSQRSVSLSGVTPLQATRAIDSFAGAGDIDANSPDIHKRAVGAAGATSDSDEDAQKAAIAAALMASPDAPQSFTDGDDNATPLPAASPPVKPQLKPSAVETSAGAAGANNVLSPSSSASSRASSALSPASERKRRTETQIFTSIMAKSIQNAAAMDGADVAASAASSSGTSGSPVAGQRRTSFAQGGDAGAQQPLTPGGRSRPLHVSTGLGERARAGTADHASAAAIGTPLTAGLVEEGGGGGDLQSYADLDDEDTPNPPASARRHTAASMLDVSEDEAHDDVHVVESFAERNQQLTVDDILSPGFGGGPSASSSAAPTPAHGEQSHARKPSMYTKEQQQASTRASSVLKFFTPNKSSNPLTIDAKRKASGASATGVTQPLSASSPRSPRAAGSTTAAASESARRVKRQDSAADVSERSLSRASGISVDETGHPAHHLGISLEHSSRGTSRSPSPSRSAGPVSGAGASAMSMPPMMPAPSPRTGKPSFPHSSPAKHSTAHLVSRTSIGRSPMSSLSKEEGARLAAAQANAAAGGAGCTGGGETPPEAGSLASYRAAMRERKLRNASRSSNSTPYGSLQLPDNAVQPHHLQHHHSASKTMPRPVSSTSLNQPPSPAAGTTHQSPSMSAVGRGGGSAHSNRSLSKEASQALTNSGGFRLSAAAAAALTPATASEAAQLEKEFMSRTRSAVELLCEQLHIPELYDVNAAAVDASPSSSGSQPATSPSVSTTAASSSGKGVNGKSLWSSLKKAVSSAATPGAIVATTSTPAAAVSPNAAAASSSPSAAASPSPTAASPTSSNQAADSSAFWFGVPVWSCTVLRCLAGWDAFAVQTFADEADASQVRRSAPRSWILSIVLGHIHQTSLRLVAHSAAGQRQKALCFFLSHLVTLIELVEAYARSPHAPPPYPLLDDGSEAVIEDDADELITAPTPALYDKQLLTPSLPAAFASPLGLFAVPQLPLESSQRVCERARRRLRGNKQAPTPRAGITPLPAGAFPYSLSLGVSTYTWFLAHLRRTLAQTYQGLLELSLTELEMLDPASILSTSQDAAAGADEVSGYEATLEQLQASLTKALEDMQSQRVLPVLQHHFFTCLLRGLNASLFNAVLSNKSLMNMTSGMRLKIVCTALANWARNQRADSGDDASSSELERIASEEMEMCKQLALLMLMDKQQLTLQDLSDVCSALTPVSLYHLLINYVPADSANSGGGNDDGEERINPAVLDELSTYQTDVLSHVAARAPGQGPPVLFPAWRVAGLVARKAKDHAGGITEEDEDENGGGGGHEGAAVYEGWAAASARRKSVEEKQKANVQSPFLDAFQPIMLPRILPRQPSSSPSSSSATRSPTSPTALLPLSAVPVPAPLAAETATFAFLQRGEQAQLVLPVCRGATE